MSEQSPIAFANLAAARALIDAFVAAGVRHAVVCPGSRSGPLALAIDERAELSTFVLFDERSAGFFALGLARRTSRPTMVVCTSGTAAANLLPAAAEAHFAEIPLLLVTADRPPEAREFGAPQTIRQVGLFGSHARASLDLATPGADGPPLDYFRASAAHAVAVASGVLRGPVHVNVPLREPLVPLPLPARDVAAPCVRVRSGTVVLDAAELEALATRACNVERGLLVCGPSSDACATAPALTELARALGWPTLADSLAGLRSGEVAIGVVDAYDASLRSAAFRRAARPDLVLRFGRPPTSKPLQQALAEWDCPQILFATPGTWPDPSWSTDELVSCDAASTASALARTIGMCDQRRLAAWVGLWERASAAARETMDASLDRGPGLFEGRVARTLARRLPEGAILFVGNSMPIRDVDAFCARLPSGTSVLANRGANGIDGVLSTALGAAVASARPAVLLLGDLSFLHDAGALQLAVRLGVPLLVVVLNNDGGGIFHMLPAAGLGDVFERCFATPHGLDLAAAAPPGGGIEIRRVTTHDELDAAIGDWLARPRPFVVEVPSDRHEAAVTRTSIVASAAAAVEHALGLAP